MVTTRRRLRLAALLATSLVAPARAQIEPQRPIAHGTIGIYQELGAEGGSWGWERVGSWGWERVGSWGWERVGSWGWERVAASEREPELVGLVFIEASALGPTTQHWAFFDNYDGRAPTELKSAHYDYPDLVSYLEDMDALARAYVPVPAGNGVCAAEPVCVTLSDADVDDTLIKAAEPDKSFGASQSLTVSAGSYGARRALLRFDTSAIPPGAYVQSAELRLSGLVGGASAAVTAVMAPWDEASVTWNDFERAGAPFGVASGGPHLWRAAATVPSTGAGATTTTALGTLVQAWVDGVVDNHGVVLDAQAAEAQVVFASHEHPDARQRPALEVCYRACESDCTETCGGGTVCAAGRCREPARPWGEIDVCDDGDGDERCSGHGTFFNGRCFCEPGYGGETCAE